MNLAIIMNNQFVFPGLMSCVYMAIFFYLRRYGRAHLCGVFADQHWMYIALERALLPLQLLLSYALIMLWVALIPTNTLAYLQGYGSIVARLLFIWWLWRCIAPLEGRWEILASSINTKVKIDRTSASAITKLLKGLLVALLFLTTVDQLGFDVSGLLAVGGIGGIIIGLAAQEVLSNFLSSIILYLERPFKVGDFIMSPDREIMGTVSEIGWRRTRLETLNKCDILVPNHVFNGIAIENFDTITRRRIEHTIGLRYQDADKIAAVVEALTEMLKNHPDLAGEQQQLVSFDAFGASSLDIKLIFYTKTSDFHQYHLVKQDVFLQVVDVVHAQGADFAFPSRSVYMEQNT